LNGDGLSTRGLSGGAVKTYEMLRAWNYSKNVTVSAITTQGGLSKLRGYGLNWPAIVLRSSLFVNKEYFKIQRFFSYIISVCDFWRRSLEFPRTDLIISSSDFYCDVWVADYFKRRHSGCRWLAMVYHLYTRPSKRPGNFLVNLTWVLLQRLSMRIIAKKADAVFVLNTDAGDQIKEYLEKLGMSPHRIKSVDCGVHFVPRRTSLVAESKKHAALFVGELRPNKGVFDLIEIWKRVVQELGALSLLLVGHGSVTVKHLLERSIRSEGLEACVVITDSIEAAELETAYQSSNLFCFPSHEEGWAIAIMEAMSHGLPVVAYDLPTYERHYKGAIAPVPSFNKPLFADTIVRLLTNPKEADHLKQIGRVLAARYSWEQVADSDWKKLYSAIESSAFA
jgi:glycosyltransferase involved in cell wall biosynthesis